MPTVNTDNVRKCLKNFDFTTLFVDELGWNHFEDLEFNLDVDESLYQISSIAEQGMVIFLCENKSTGKIPYKNIRKRIENQVRHQAHEHLLIFVDKEKTKSVWMWVRREAGKNPLVREQQYSVSQEGVAIIQKLAGIAFDIDELDDEGRISISTVTQRVARQFEVEKVTKKFYKEFDSHKKSFEKFIDGIENLDHKRWYASVMLNRLMFIYFVQKKGFLDKDIHYLSSKFAEIKKKGKDRYYRDFLVKLFFEGFAIEEKERSKDTQKLLGDVPYLNGGLFLPHEIEEAHGDKIKIADKAFEKLFKFFEQYTWHLDERPLRNENEINPDVLGYIFEKYINQKQMGAYYTKEDITNYICKNTIIPFLFNKHENRRYNDVVPLPIKDIEPYIYDSVKKGIELELPDYIAVGLSDVSKRTRWNEPADTEYALPTEIWREVVARRHRYEQIKEDFKAGKIQNINDFITYNLDIEAYTQDWLSSLGDPVSIRAFYFNNLTQVTVLDPTCGSGAFLFAALNILYPLYEICLDKMAEMAGPKFKDFRDELQRVGDHSNEEYFIYKSIIINNLFGVDIMEEAVEICKLRLFLKLVSQVDDVNRIEPLPDIDFNIKSGNTLVGYASLQEIEEVKSKELLLGEDIVTKVKEADRALSNFRKLQTESGISSSDLRKSKQEAKNKLKEIQEELDKDLAESYGVKTSFEKAYTKWRKSYQPFHWFVEFYDIISNGGFNVIVGNPPYVEYSKVKGLYELKTDHFKTLSCGNLYAILCERIMSLIMVESRLGVIIPVASVCTSGYEPLQKLLHSKGNLIISSFNDRPGKLFEGLEHIRLSVILCEVLEDRQKKSIFTTKYNKWNTVQRPHLFENLQHNKTDGMYLNGSIPKTGDSIEDSILQKLFSQKHSISQYCGVDGHHNIYYTRKLSGFVQVLNFVPSILDSKGKPREPSELKQIPLEDKMSRNVFLALYNSNFFYWFLTVFSDCRNLNKRELYNILFDIDDLNERLREKLSELSESLMDDFQTNSQMVEMNYKKLGTLKIQCIYPKHSKSIIDEIDQALAKHYGFTEEELDFIINYDIKYRMGIT